MLEERGADYRYREFKNEPLDEDELRELFEKLGASPGDLLRRRDRAFKELGLTGDEDDATLIAHMARHPTLLQRPIAVRGERAVVGRPVENLLDLLEGDST